MLFIHTRIGWFPAPVSEC